MIKKTLVLVFAASAFCLSVRATDFWTPGPLAKLSSTSVLSIAQDNRGAIWMNTGKGLFRYNGTELKSVSEQFINNHIEYDGGKCIYALSHGALLCFDSATLQSYTIKLPESIPWDSPFMTGGGMLWLGSYNRLYSVAIGGGYNIRVEREFSPELTITAVCYAADRIMVGTKKSGILITNSEGQDNYIVPCNSEVVSLFCDGYGLVWAGLKEGGIVVIDPSSGSVLLKTGRFGNVVLHDVRSFSERQKGELICGTANGVFVLDYSVGLQHFSAKGVDSRPVYKVFVDRDGNIWNGTYYHGISVFSPDRFPFESVPIPGFVSVIRGLAEDSSGRIWILTDGNGMYSFDRKDGSLRHIPGTDGIKFQGAFYDKETDSVWAGEFRGAVLQYNVARGSLKGYPLVADDNSFILKIIRNGENLILGGTNGIFLFNPSKERSIRRKVPFFDAQVLDMQPSGDGRVLIASMGIYEFDGGSGVRKLEHLPAISCSQIAMDGRGGFWLAFSRRGLAHVAPDGKQTMWNSSNCALADNWIQCVVPCSDGRCVVGTSSGISVLDPATGGCLNYSSFNGLNFASARGGTSLVMSDGTIWIGGNEAVESISGGLKGVSVKPRKIVIDRIEVNGRPIGVDLSSAEKLVLSHDQTNFSILISDFDYTSEQSQEVRYIMEGLEGEWKTANVGEGITFLNMVPGRYLFRAELVQPGAETSVVTLPLIIKNVWFRTRLARGAFVLIFLLITVVIVYSVVSRRKIASELEKKVLESEEKTRFFVNISNRLRTPLNLMIGQIECFFKDYGARTNGIEDIQDVYNKALSMRALISGYLDEQNEDLENNSTDVRVVAAVRDAKFLNAAIGVVERNMFSGKVGTALLCSELNMGKTNLTKRIKHLTGLTPRQFVEDILLNHAAQMLKDGSYRVGEISERLLFSSPKYFCTKFHEKFGCSPRDYQNSTREY